MSGRAWGVILLAFGVLLLLGSLGYGGLDWDTVWRLWPAVLIYSGLFRILRYAGFV